MRCAAPAAVAIPDPAPGEGPLLADYKEHHTDVSVHFDVDLVPGKLAALAAAAGGLEAKFKLSSKISTGGLRVWCCARCIQCAYTLCIIHKPDDWICTLVSLPCRQAQQQQDLHRCGVFGAVLVCAAYCHAVQTAELPRWCLVWAPTRLVSTSWASASADAEVCC